MKNTTKYLIEYLSIQVVNLPADTFGLGSNNDGSMEEERFEE